MLFPTFPIFDFFKMNKIYRLLIAGCILTTGWACTDDKIVMDPQEEASQGYIGEGDPLEVFVENSEVRTRDVDFDEEATVRVNSVWLGVFDSTTGYCVSKYSTEAGYAFLASGQLSYGLIRHSLPAPSLPAGYTGTINNASLVMVAVVNYKGVEGRESGTTSQIEPLEALLNKVKTWNEFNSIGIDTYSAYYGGENNDHSTDAPLMAGFMNSSAYTSAASTHIKVNQFNTNTNDKMPLSMNGNISNLYISYNTNTKKYVTGNSRIYLRRLLSNFNIRIKAAEHLEVTSISYKKYNVPGAVYILERTMLPTGNNGTKGAFPSSAALSPNFADLFPTQGGYSDDIQETPVDINQSSNNEWKFSFQHFANKHWARTTPATYADREDYNEVGGVKVFKSLATNEGDFNNKASYFEINMRIIDRNTNRCAETTFIIHEGYTSDDEGKAVDWSFNNKGELVSSDKNALLSDYSCARNRSYLYNIQVNGFDNIVYNVEGGNYNNVTAHRKDQQGKVWTFTYVGSSPNAPIYYNPVSGDYDAMGTFSNFLTGSGDVEIEGENLKYKRYPSSFIIKDNSTTPYIAWRIYGYDSDNEVIQGYNYHFEDVSFNYLRGMWPPSVGGVRHTYSDYNALIVDYLSGMSMDDIDKHVLAVDGSDKAKADLEKALSFLKKDEVTQSMNVMLFNAFKFEVSDGQPKHVIGGEDQYETVVITGDSPDGGVDSEGHPTYEKWTVKTPRNIDMGKPMNIVEFMRALNYLIDEQQGLEENEKLLLPLKYDVLISARDFEKLGELTGRDPNELVRCLYIGDRSGHVDTDGCSTLIDIYSFIQGIDR